MEALKPRGNRPVSGRMRHARVEQAFVDLSLHLKAPDEVQEKAARIMKAVYSLIEDTIEGRNNHRRRRTRAMYEMFVGDVMDSLKGSTNKAVNEVLKSHTFTPDQRQYLKEERSKKTGGT